MTYRDLAKIISEMTEEQKDMTVTVNIVDYDEFIPVENFSTRDTDGILDENHPYLTI